MDIITNNEIIDIARIEHTSIQPMITVIYHRVKTLILFVFVQETLPVKLTHVINIPFSKIEETLFK